jgi:hypothetical protein
MQQVDFFVICVFYIYNFGNGRLSVVLFCRLYRGKPETLNQILNLNYGIKIQSKLFNLIKK